MQELPQDRLELAARTAVEELRKMQSPSHRDVQVIKQRAASESGSPSIPRNSELLKYLAPGEEDLRTLLTIKVARNISGVAVIAAMSRPAPCPPQARCIYCPGGVAFGSPKSYTGKEPAALRGAQNDYDSFREVRNRLRQLEEIGHSTGKAELIIMGGTFLSFDPSYQEGFVKGLYEGLNGERSPSLEEAIRVNETAGRRCVGLTLETRPDCLGGRELKLLLRYGATRVEIGVQSLDDGVLAFVNRGHGVEETARAFMEAKDAGLKVVAHMMPGLPGSSVEKDLKSFRMLFEDERFKPDMLKIYPTLVIGSAPLHRLYEQGKYVPYTLDQTVELVAKAKEMTPPWIRIMRVQRDIPAYMIEAGVKVSNLRELARRRLEEQGKKCSCIRCREVGVRSLPPSTQDAFGLQVSRYEASGGEEVFLSYVDENDSIAGFSRMRIPGPGAHALCIDPGSAVIRELRVYGRLVDVGQRRSDGWQHRGFGAKLMAEAERLAAEEFDKREMVVTSAVGTREYYAKLGYSRKGPYMAKPIAPAPPS
ncbi:MAG: tRNA uridine(34) 5-carboxymethylaminomethyl modification radical SAM/GNAT enzyme Elp3 [Conexivisphaerales archaeon]